ncbi:MAG: lmo0937 family membrane protein [Thaumarchaeota archaeon]|nr:lmo0937 family membrane protein [Nitrososphaerota archaeon]
MDLFWTVALVLVALWLLGIIGGIGGELINILIIAAVVVVGVRLYQGKNVVTGK